MPDFARSKDEAEFRSRHTIEKIDPSCKIMVGLKSGVVTEVFDDGAFFGVQFEDGTSGYLPADTAAILNKVN